MVTTLAWRKTLAFFRVEPAMLLWSPAGVGE